MTILTECESTSASRERVHGRRTRLTPANRRYVEQFAADLFGGDLHALTVLSLANGVVGVLTAAVLAIHAIGQALAKVAGITPKSGVKQVDRLLSNNNFVMEKVLGQWVRFVIGVRKEIVIALDWTEFEKDDHSTLCAYLVTRHGRATPLYWKTVKKSGLKGKRNQHEDDLIEKLHDSLPPDVAVTLLADRGFGDQKLYRYLDSLGWKYVIRFREGITVEDAHGLAQPASAWVFTNGRARMLRDVRVTNDRARVPAVVLVRAARMKEAWCLATNRTDACPADVVKLYGKRFTIEETFRDQKDIHFGMGLSATHIKNADRRDRLLMLVALAHTLLTLLGAAAEAAGLDRILKANTVKRRTHSLFRQGSYWYGCIPTMRSEWLQSLMTAFDRIVREHHVLRDILGVI